MSTIDDLAQSVKRYLSTEGDYQTVLPTLAFYRRHVPTEPIQCIYPLGLALTLQREKHVMVGNKTLQFSPGQAMLATTIEKPILSHVTCASSQTPYLGLFLQLDIHEIAMAVNEIKPPLARESLESGLISINELDPMLCDALCRLISLLDDPLLLSCVAPLIQKEIILRLLRGPYGTYLTPYN